MEVKPYDFGGKTVRVIVRNDGTLEWVAVDACQALGLKNSRQSLSTLDDDEKSSVRLTDSGLPRQTVLEPGLYRLISRSKKKTAKRFQRWVYHDVLPTIRQTGRYSVKPEYPLPQTYSEALRELAVKVEENEILKPKADNYDMISSSFGLVCISDCAKILQIPPHTFSYWLRRDEYCFKRRGKMIPYQAWIDNGWFQVKLVPASDGTAHTYRQTFVTPKGTQKFREIYNPGQKQRRLFA